MHPVLRRTWAEKGCTPIIRPRGRSLEKVSGAGALAISPKGRRLNWYLSLLPKENFRWPRLLTFFKQLRRHVRGPVILIWDRSQSHKNAQVMHYLTIHAGWQVELLPSYAPELNPVEHFWSYFKFGRLSNFTPNTTEEIRKTVRCETRRAQRSQRLIRSIARRCSLSLF
jgi:transposase